MDEETSDATIQSESPGPRAPADRGPILNSARACCLPDCRTADVAVVAFWLVSVWKSNLRRFPPESTRRPSRHQRDCWSSRSSASACGFAGSLAPPRRAGSRRGPSNSRRTRVRDTGIGKEIAPFCYLLLSCSRRPQAARPPGSVASSNRLLACRLPTGRRLLSRCSGWTSWPGREKDLRSFPFVMKNKSLCLVSLQAASPLPVFMLFWPDCSAAALPL